MGSGKRGNDLRDCMTAKWRRPVDSQTYGSGVWGERCISGVRV